jgi:membrane protein YqaA with SNARE-associated domain
VERAWLYPLIATAGSVLGTAATLWMGKKLGESGNARYVPERRLKAAKAQVKNKGAAPIALLGIVPPPFPFTAFVLASGALKVNIPRFLADAMQFIVGGLIVLAFAGTAVMLFGAVRQRRFAAG